MMSPRKTETEESVKTIVFVLLKHDEPLETLHLVISLTASNQSVCNGSLGCSSGTVRNQLAKLQYKTLA